MRVKSLESSVKSRKFASRRFRARAAATHTALALHSDSRLSTLDSRLFRGMTLTEVLISMGLMTLGLLGVLSLFPVGSFYMAKADQADSGHAVARSVMSDLVSRGMLKPAAWRMMANVPSLTVDDKNTTGVAITNAYSRPVGPAIETLNLQAGLTPWQRIQRSGNIYILDPMAAAATTLAGSAAVNKQAAVFPAEAYMLPPAAYSSCAAWQPWLGNSDYWPVRRVTFVQPAGAIVARMDAPLSWSLFTGNSDLTFEHPSTNDQPAMQLIGYNSSRAPLTRQSTGDYSWVVTVAPTTMEARNGLSYSSDFAYDVSVVVFQKRGIPVRPPANATDVGTNATELRNRERIVKAKIVSTGPSGGEVLIEAMNTSVANPFQFLRAGQWVMLCGPTPIMEAIPTPADAQFAAKWYQVQAIDEDGAGITSFNPTTMRLLSLRGPEWAWQPQGAIATALSNNLCVGIFPGAVAVHTKTLRLQSAAF